LIINSVMFKRHVYFKHIWRLVGITNIIEGYRDYPGIFPEGIHIS
jgi:hypothetical protein